eukprot:CFRG0656T1
MTNDNMPTTQSSRAPCSPRLPVTPRAKTTMTDIGDFEIEGELGRGCYAVVYSAKHKVSGCRVAIKAITKGRTDGERVSTEVMAMSLCANHSSIARLYNSFEDENFVYLVMEVVRGVNLHDYIKKNGRIPEVQARKWFKDLLSAIVYCHDMGVVHRDLKNANIMVDEERMEVKIVDFGMSVVLKDPHNDLIFLSSGSPVFAAPEIYFVSRGEGYKAMPAELWSLGVILHSMLASSLPYDIDSYTSHWETYSPPRQSSGQVKHLLSIMFQFRIRCRYSLADILDHPWMKQKEEDFHSPSLCVSANPVRKLSITSFVFDDDEDDDRCISLARHKSGGALQNLKQKIPLMSQNMDWKQSGKTRESATSQSTNQNVCFKSIALNIKSRATRTAPVNGTSNVSNVKSSSWKSSSVKSTTVAPIDVCGRERKPSKCCKDDDQSSTMLEESECTDAIAVRYAVQAMARAGYTLPEIKETVKRHGSGLPMAGRRDSDVAFDLILDDKLRSVNTQQLYTSNSCSISPHRLTLADLGVENLSEGPAGSIEMAKPQVHDVKTYRHKKKGMMGWASGLFQTNHRSHAPIPESA